MSIKLVPGAADPVAVCIVGGGFCGVALAWQLLHTLQRPQKIILVNKGTHIGHGLAYGTASPHHLLNVPAGRMGIDPVDEAGFLRYLHGLGLPFGAGDFVPRSLYGAYLEHALGRARTEAAAFGVHLQVLQASAVDVKPGLNGDQEVSLDDGSCIWAWQVVLALGNFSAAPPLLQSGLDWGAPGLVQSAWELPHMDAADMEAPVLLLGSGLTAFDALLELRHRGHRGPVTMLSRRGLLAQSHRQQERVPPHGVVPANVLEDVTSVREMLREVRDRIRQARQDGHDWRDVIGGLRESTPRLWRQLSLAERARFVRHLTPYWDTHRHRAAVAIAQAVKKELVDGTLSLMAGRLRYLQQAAGRWQTTVSTRGTATLQTSSFSVVVNCTGPSSNVRASADPLILALLRQGKLLPDALKLGLQVDDAYRLCDVKGHGQSGLYYLGPLLKADWWEATAVPELRQHAARLAKLLVAQNHAVGM